MNVTRLRSDIDAGKTGDKTPGIDPAAAPLGTDEEAAGTPVAPHLAEEVRRSETEPDAPRRSRQNAGASEAVSGATDTNTVPAGRLDLRWLAVALLLMLALLGLGLWWTGAQG
ncbi:MAG: hypothetical protein ACOY4R_07035 [Pseudomonadota bacterium]